MSTLSSYFDLVSFHLRLNHGYCNVVVRFFGVETKLLLLLFYKCFQSAIGWSLCFIDPYTYDIIFHIVEILFVLSDSSVSRSLLPSIFWNGFQWFKSLFLVESPSTVAPFFWSSCSVYCVSYLSLTNNARQDTHLVPFWQSLCISIQFPD